MGLKSGPVLYDFGEARTGKDTYTKLIQPPVYRAPEVFLRLPWGTPIDIWNFGCMLWHFTLGHHLFSRPSSLDEDAANKIRLAQVVALLGPPPEALLSILGPRALAYLNFNEDGSSSAKETVPTPSNLETLESRFASWQERAQMKMTTATATATDMTPEEEMAFLAFMMRCLTWKGDERESASELLDDPWLVR